MNKLVAVFVLSFAASSAVSASVDGETIPASNVENGLLRSKYILVDGAPTSTLKRLKEEMESRAYGDRNVEIDPAISPTAFIKTSSEKPLKKEARDPLAETEDDLCDSFYMPTARLRIFKSLPESDPCKDRGTMILADTNRQILFLCKDGTSVADYDFSMGSNGVDKKILGDKKTPLGSYPLASARKSDLFGTFIHIGYPRPDQLKSGYTGSDVGIHGPARFFRCAGFLNSIVNWTQGCIAVSSDRFIKEIGRFVRANRVKEVVIEPLP